MSHGYQDYGGNPYDQQAPSPYQQQGNPYAQPQTTSQSGYGAPNPYGTAQQPPQSTGAYASASYPTQTQTSNYSTYPPAPAAGAGVASPAYGAPGAADGAATAAGYGGQPGVVHVPAPPTTLSNQDFLARVESIRGQIRELTNNVSEIGTTHQRLIGSPDANHAQLDNLVANTQVLNTKIQSQIRSLEADALKSGDNTTKKSQIRTLKGQFRSQLEDYAKEEQVYKKRYQEQIAREYRIVNPEATDSEVREAAEADWGNEGVFQTALKSNRTGAATSVLGNVRARHNDIQRIEKTLVELSQMFTDLAAQVELQDPQVTQAEDQTANVQKDTTAGNKQLDQGIKHARTARKLKWGVFWAIVIIIILVVAIVGGILGYNATHQNNKVGSSNNNKMRRDAALPAAAAEQEVVKRMVAQLFNA